ncbi:uncharacterized protein LOC119465210 isoform X2 [Dermacentor silvarum]|nr:uncharacterized protein LOC119465210 isoform X2 [Dermacentor silvarum]XP_049512632.1 uncharacterized protein LOC119465210 isoform X2 [Dermacentor silvarum]
MQKPEETSNLKKTQRVSRVMTIIPRPSPTEKLGERSAPPISKVNSNFPKGRIVTPVAAAPDSGGGSVLEALSKSFPPVVPVKLWRNPAPMIRVNKPSTLQHPLGQLEVNLGRPSTLLVNSESSMHSTAGRNDDSTSSSDASGEYVLPVVNKKKEQPPAPKRSPPPKLTVLWEYRTHRRKRQCKKQDPRVVSPSAKCNASNKNDNVNVAMMSSTCIDRPCVVSMYHLNDQVLANGFVNLTTVKHEDLFLLASSPVVRLSSDKLVVSKVELKPRASDTLQQSAEVSSITDTDDLEQLLKEQRNVLVQLRKKYKKLSP